MGPSLIHGEEGADVRDVTKLQVLFTSVQTHITGTQCFGNWIYCRPHGKARGDAYSLYACSPCTPRTAADPVSGTLCFGQNPETPLGLKLFLGAFTKLRRATVTYFMSVRPSIRLPHGKTRFPVDEFSWNLILYFENPSRKFSLTRFDSVIRLILTRITGTGLEDQYMFDHISLNST